MAAFTYPGVYIEEISSGQHTISGVATSIAAFVGWSNQGSVTEAVMVESWSEYQALYGGLIPGQPLGYAVYQFFLNGGSQAYIVRLAGSDAQTAVSTIGGLTLYASNPGAWANGYSVAISNVNTVALPVPNTTFNLQVFNAKGQVVESYTNLSVNSADPKFAVTVVNNDSNYITFTSPPPTSKTPTSLSTPSPTFSSVVAGSVTGTAKFIANEQLKSTSGAIAYLVGTVATGASSMTIGPYTGTPGANDVWTGSSSNATFQATALPAAFIVAGYVTGANFFANEKVTSSPGGASANLIGGAPAGATSITIGPLGGSAPTATDVWTGGKSGATFAATALPVTSSFIVAGSVTGGSFIANEPVKATSGATANLIGAVLAGATSITIGPLGGSLPKANDVWSGASATFQATALPVISSSSVAGSVNPVKNFTANEKVTSPTASANLVGAVAATATSMSIGPYTGTPGPTDLWTGASGATFTATAPPVPTSQTAVPVPLNGGDSPQSGNDGTALVPNDIGGKFAAALDVADALGTPPAGTTGLSLLNSVPIFNILCVPGENDAAVVPLLQQYCYQNRAFLIVDADQNATLAKLSANGPQDYANNTYSSEHPSYGGFYYPWILAPDPQVGNRAALFPPCGYVAGAFATTDASRGVWKAPAGIHANLSGSLGLQTMLTDLQNGALNQLAVNCLRQFPIYGNVVWGARTMDGADVVGSDYKYIPIRRLAMFIESSLYQGTQWVVFEPNAEPLWGQVRLSVGTFLQDLFLKGAFAGSTPQQAYFVKCDADNNPDSSIALGIVNITVGFAPLYPAEFVVIQITQMLNS